MTLNKNQHEVRLKGSSEAKEIMIDKTTAGDINTIEIKVTKIRPEEKSGGNDAGS